MSSKVIVITGVSKGLGRTMTTYFLSHGHTVIGCARSQDILSDMRAEFASASDRCHLSVVDVSKDAEVETWAKEVFTIASPDIVISNAAGMVSAFRPFWCIPAEECDRIIDISLKGQANVMRHFLPHMIKAGRGVLVNFSSIAGTQSVENMAPVCAARHGCEGLSKAVSQELPEPLCSVTVDPGAIATETACTLLSPEVTSKLMTAKDWAEKASPFILTIDRSMNGKCLNIPEILSMKCGVATKDGWFRLEGIDN